MYLNTFSFVFSKLFFTRIKRFYCNVKTYTHITFSSDTIFTNSAKNLNDVVSFKSSGTAYSFRSPNATSIPSKIHKT